MPRTRRPGLALLPFLALLGLPLAMPHPAAAAVEKVTNGKIAFQSNRTGEVQVYTMNADGSSETKLTSVNDRSSQAAWYPDGTGLAFANCCDQGTSKLEIYEVNANGSGTTRITDNDSRDALPAWSPDGSKVAFVSSRDGDKEIYVMNADGTGQKNLSDDPSADDAPAWSPDGSQILFASKRSGNWDLWVMDADGTDVEQMTNGADSDTEPDWSPNGSQITFVSDRSDDKDVYVKDPQLGDHPTNLTDNSTKDDDPVWSPDGKKIAFDSNRSGNLDIWVMDADGTSPTSLTSDPGKDQRPTWQPVTDPTFEGLDISHWQGSIDFDKVAGAGIRFVFTKASEGKSYEDPNYATNRAGASAAGIAFGAYHYAKPDTSDGDAVAEADHFIDTAQPAPGDLLPVIDLEDAGGLSDSKLTTWLWDFLDQVEARTGVKALIYTSPNFWETHLGDTDAFAEGGYKLLWIAHWFVKTPTVPGNNWGGHGWTFWQNDDCFSVPGISGCVDHDFYNGIILTPAEMP